jgi:hypothetical protein
MTSDVQFSVWSRFVLPLLDHLQPGVARKILRMKFTKSELSRMARLSELASEGMLTEEQRRELESYLRMGSILTIMHSKARVALKRCSTTGQRKSA